MKIFKLLIIILVAFLFNVSTANAYIVTMENWGFDPSGSTEVTNVLISPIDEITLLGMTLNNSTPTALGYGTFETFGTLSATGFQVDGNPIGAGITGLGVNYELTVILETSGFYIRPVPGGNNLLTFNSGSLTFYLDSTQNYGTTAGTYGADDGTLIASFDLIIGSGTMDFVTSEFADGRTDILFGANYLMEGIWFDPNGNDLALSNYMPLILGLTDSNNVVVEAPNQTIIDEFLAASDLEYDGRTDYEFFVRTDGSFAPAPIPEPATMFLFGCGLICFGIVGKKRVLKN